MKEREFRDLERQGRHPAACTCVDCTNRRLRRVRAGGNPLKRFLDIVFRRR